MLIVQILAGLLIGGGCAYLLLALYRLRLPFPAAAPLPEALPPITLMVPLHGLSPRLEDCLERLYGQDYPRVQLLFGLQDPEDPARLLVERLMAAHPGRDHDLVIDRRRIGANPKNGNLANMMGRAKHDLLVMVDADVLVEPGFLATMAGCFADPRIGGATCLYSAVAEPGFASRLGALAINDWFVPSVLVDLGRPRPMDLCYGAAIAVTRHALERIGGFEAMADAVAQDYVIGHALCRAGFTLRLAPAVVRTVVGEADLPGLLAHELRWNRAVRAVRPLEHALSVFMQPLLPGGLPLLLTGAARLAWPLLAVYLGLRLALHWRLRRRFALPPAEPWLLPLRELLTGLVWITAFLGRRIRWGDTVLVTGDGLRMHPLPDPAPPEPQPERQPGSAP